jgi:hypothetical protein
MSMLESVGGWIGWGPIAARREPDPPLDETPQERRRRRNFLETRKVLLWWAGLSLAALLLYGLIAQPKDVVNFISAAAMAAAASASVGALLGFLFGIPRSLQQEAPVTPPPSPPPPLPPPPVVPPAGQATPQGLPTPPTATPASTSVKDRGNQLRVNTNLEQISDWLTKILVGVGLTQLQFLWPNLIKLAEFQAPAMNGSVELAMTCILNFAIWGFFAAYLVTRLFLAEAFGLADAANEQAARLEQYAFVLTRAGAHKEAGRFYGEVLRHLAADASPEQVLRAVEGKVYNALYEDPPRGFEQAINVARQHLDDTSRPASGKLWAYLAMGYGQQFRYELSRDTNPEQLNAIRADARDAVREAIRLEPAMRSLLRSVWDPNDPNKASRQEDDLEVFFGDDEFRSLLQ